MTLDDVAYRFCSRLFDVIHDRNDCPLTHEEAAAAKETLSHLLHDDLKRAEKSAERTDTTRRLLADASEGLPKEE